MNVISILAAFALNFFPGLAYTNPIIASDYSDPDVICVNGEYWMTASSFNCVPGLQILHSTDLINWEIVSAALPEGLASYADIDRSVVQHGNGVWAPSIRYRESDGLFYIFWGDPDRGIYQVHSQNPAGEWSRPVQVIEGEGLIDPCPLFDEDGKVYLVHAWAGSRAGFKSVLNVCELSPDASSCIGPQVLVFDGNLSGDITVEGPKFYKRNGYYYIFAPAGGVKDGWQLAMRSKSPYGPYEGRRVMEEADEADVARGLAAPTHGPHQGAWVEDAAGSSWFIHFEDRHAWGRVLHLQPMSWLSDGWCVIGRDIDNDGIGEPVAGAEAPAAFPANKLGGTDAAQSELNFSGMVLPLNWQWAASPELSWAMPNPSDNSLRLNCVAMSENTRNLWDVPNLLLEKTLAPKTLLEAELLFSPSYAGDRCGVVVMGTDYSSLELFFDGKDIYIERRICEKAEKGEQESVIARTKLPDAAIRTVGNRIFCTLRISVKLEEQGGWPPYARASFSYETEKTGPIEFGPAFTAVAGKWIGGKIGFFATAEIAKNDGGFVYIKN